MNTTNPYAPPQAAVRDVADPDAGAEPAGRGTRLVAAILDGIIMVGMIYLPMIFGLGIRAAQSHGSGNPHVHISPIGGLLTLVGLIAWIWLTVLFVSRNGQSIAKKMMGIKVVRSDGSPASLGRIFWLRNVVNTLLGILPLYGLVDALLIFGDARQCVHDKIADTIVIKA
jgi:uncharacterized RDD family membrane protein YckC